jgi:L-fuconolactonase
VPLSAAPAIVDAHHHLWDFAARPQPWLHTAPELAPLHRSFLLRDLLPQAAAAGVTASVVVQTVEEPGETPELLTLAATGPLVAAVVGWTDLTAADVADTLGELASLPGGQYLAGIRHPLLTESDPDWLGRADVRRGLRAVAAAGLTFDLVLPPGQLPSAVRATAEVPELTFVLDHLGNVAVSSSFDTAWAAAFTELADLPNCVCKLSGILGVPRPPGGGQADDIDPVAHLRPYADLALNAFGPDRLMFGSEWPVSTLGTSYADVVATAVALTDGLSRPEQAAILGGTARAVYGIH